MSEIKEQLADQDIAVQYTYIRHIRQYHIGQGKQPKALIITYGCQQNQNDSERLRGMLAEAGYGFCEAPAEADLILYNTCAVRENAELKVFGNLGALKHEKRRRPELIIGVCGCMMQQAHIAEEIQKKYRHVDIIFGTHTLHTFPQLVWQALDRHEKSVNIQHIDGRIVEDIPIRREGGVKAYISVMYGCNNFCSYCIVPYVRGRERSRRADDILAEVRQAASEGYKEIMLLGQNVNSYGNDSGGEIDFSDLLIKVAAVPGIERIRFMTSHPKDFDDKLMYTMAQCEKICAQLHLPVQAGSDKVLKDMNRKYTSAQYREKIRKVRSLIPDLAITSDIIVGFPTETNEDFEKTIELLKEVRFDTVFSFIYSRRSGTPAADMDFMLTDEEIHRNFDRLLEVQNKLSRQINDTYAGKVYDILVEGKSKTDKSMMTGRTASGKIVNFAGEESLVGKIVPVLITAANTWSLSGEVVL